MNYGKVVICGPLTITGDADAKALGDAALAAADAVVVDLQKGEKVPEAHELDAFVEKVKDRIPSKDLERARLMATGIKDAAVAAIAVEAAEEIK